MRRAVPRPIAAAPEGQAGANFSVLVVELQDRPSVGDHGHLGAGFPGLIEKG